MARRRDELWAVRLALWAVVIGFTGYLIWEFTVNGPSSFPVVWGEIWGRATIIDFYILIGLFSGWIVYREPSLTGRIFLPLVMCLTGCVGVAGYLLWALRPVHRWQDMPTFFLGRNVP